MTTTIATLLNLKDAFETIQASSLSFLGTLFHTNEQNDENFSQVGHVLRGFPVYFLFLIMLLFEEQEAPANEACCALFFVFFS